MRVTALIADDEQLAREKLREFLDEVDWIQCVGEAVDGLQAVQLANREKPNLLFLDIRMPGLSGLEVLTRLKSSPTIIFTTAHDEYAVTAFELHALDYLLKPFGRRRFREAIARVERALPSKPETSSLERGRQALASRQPLRRLFVRSRGRILPVAVEDVIRFEAQGDYVEIHLPEGRYLANLRMGDLERLLDPDRFLRVHRSHIVNLDHVSKMLPHESDRLLVQMDDGAELYASRARSRALRKRVV